MPYLGVGGTSGMQTTTVVASVVRGGTCYVVRQERHINHGTKIATGKTHGERSLAVTLTRQVACWNKIGVLAMKNFVISMTHH